MTKASYYFCLLVSGTALLTEACHQSTEKNNPSTTQNIKKMDEMQKLEQTTSKDGTVISYIKSGIGSPLLLVHGMAADHRSWGYVSPLLEQDFTVYAIDRRGRGASGDSPDYDFMREAEDIAAVIEAIGEPVFLFGHSLGALLCLEATLLTDKVSRLVLYEPPIPTEISMVPDAVADSIQALVDRGELENAMELALREVALLPDHELQAYRQTPLWNARIPIARTIPRELQFDQTYRFNAKKFANLNVPTMLLLGAESPSVARDEIEKVNAALPDSKISILPGQGHMAHHSNPELLATELIQFLQN